MSIDVTNAVRLVERNDKDVPVGDGKPLIVSSHWNRDTLVVLEEFVRVVARGAKLRDQIGMDVRVGSHVPPRGSPYIRSDLANLLYCVGDPAVTPYGIHVEYETLHPFMDGNGRSGRALWLWMMQRDGLLDNALGLGFLHSWYYQSLQGARP